LIKRIQPAEQSSSWRQTCTTLLTANQSIYRLRRAEVSLRRAKSPTFPSSLKVSVFESGFLWENIRPKD
jgi:hypothetical protein